MESGRSFGLVQCIMEPVLDTVILRAPRVREVDKFQIHCLKAVLLACESRVVRKSNEVALSNLCDR